ncbi:MAG: HAD-IA family hydrolase [Candidatus Omnitrophica bacterium]|nr:HAD-IA family hydrolase [Candidatus Omnitrophota bacterium]
MREIDLIIFDFDGTLVDSREDIANAVNFTLRELGLKERGFQEIMSHVGKGLEYLMEKILGEDSISLVAQALAIFKDYYREHFKDNSLLYPGVKEMLEYFKDKNKVVVSNKQRDFVVLTLKGLGADGYFKEIIGGDNGKCVKPNPCPLNDTMQRFGIEKQKTIMVGDMDIDVLAGKEAGTATCAVTYGIGTREQIEKARPDYIIDDIKKLEEIIR